MPGDTFKKVQTGQSLKVPAPTWNAFIDAAQDFKARQRSRKQASERRIYQTGIFLCRNETGGDLAQHAVVGIDSPIIEPTDNEHEFRNRASLVGVTPASAHAARWAILQEPAAANEIASAAVAGVTVAKVNVLSESHDRAERVIGQTGYLNSGTTGSAVILWKEAGTGVKWALIRIDEAGESSGLTFFQLKEDLAPGQYADAYVLSWDDDLQQMIVTCEEISVRDVYGGFRGYGRVADCGGSSSSGTATVDGFRGAAQDELIVFLQSGITMFLCEAMDTEEITEDVDTIAIDTATIQIFQPTTPSPWYTTDGEPPDTVGNSLNLSGLGPFITGMMMMWRKSKADIPTGWARVDGTSNADAYEDGEDVINMVEYFPFGRDTDDAMDDLAQGSDTHDHGDTLTAATGITAAADETCINPNVLEVAPRSGDPTDLWGYDGGTASALCHDHTVSVTDPEHKHATSDATILPPHKKPHFIEPDKSQPKRLLLCVWNDALTRYEAVFVSREDPSSSSSGA